MQWADALVWSTALDLAPAHDDDRIRGLLHHVHAVQWAYLQLMRGDAVSILELATLADLPSVHRWGRRGHAELETFVSTLHPEELERQIEFPWAEQLTDPLERIHPTDLRQALLQVASHSTYHRGQINTRIRELGGEPPLTDFVAWVWAGQPVAGWTEIEE